MKLPNKLVLGAYTIQVQEIPGLSDCGQYLTEPPRIQVRKELSDVEKRETFLHEIMHAIWDYFNLGDQSDEEHTVTTLSRGLIAVFDRNMAVRKYIMKGNK